MTKGLHIDKDELFCNRCNKYVCKYTEIIVIYGEVHCFHCDNWLCGEYDAFGIVEDPSVEHIKMMGQK